MKLKQAKEVCKFFEPKVLDSGKTTCKHKLKNLCCLPGNLYCRLILDKARKEPHISVSQATTFLQCQYKWVLSYVLKQKVIQPSYFWLGSQFHEIRPLLDENSSYKFDVMALPSAGYDVSEIERARLQAMLRYYASRVDDLPRPQSNERPFKLSLGDDMPVIVGAIDGYDTDPKEDDGLYLYEYKYSSGEYDFLTLRRQLSIYFAANPDHNRCMIIAVKKPQNKPKKGELVSEFAERLFGEIKKQKFEDVIKIRVYDKESFPIERELATMKVVVKQMEAVKRLVKKWKGNGDVPVPCNYFDCKNCHYKAVCKSNIGDNDDDIF